jgi:hypothetical protein
MKKNKPVRGLLYGKINRAVIRGEGKVIESIPYDELVREVRDNRRNPASVVSENFIVELTYTQATALVMLLEDEQGRGASEIAETLGCSEHDAEKFLTAVTPLVKGVKHAMMNGD